MKRRICIIVLTLAIVFTSIVPIFAIQEDDPRETPHRTIVAASDYHGCLLYTSDAADDQ